MENKEENETVVVNITLPREDWAKLAAGTASRKETMDAILRIIVAEWMQQNTAGSVTAA